MRYTLLGRSGLRVSQVALGTMTFGEAWGWGASKDECRRIFDTFVAEGGNFVDTACNYTDGQSEEIVGELVASDRDHFVVATKYTLTARREDPNAGGNHRKNLVRTLEASLQRLQYRLRGSPLAPHVGRDDTGGGGRPRSRRPRLDGEGAVRRDLRYPRVGRVAGGHTRRAAWLDAVRRGSGSVLPPGPRRRARAPADGAVARDDVHVVGHARRRSAHREVPGRERRASPVRRRRATSERPRPRGRRSRGGDRRDSGAGRNRLGARTAVAHGSDRRSAQRGAAPGEPRSARGRAGARAPRPPFRVGRFPHRLPA